MAEEACVWARTCQYDVKTDGLADASSTAPMTVEETTRWCINTVKLSCSFPKDESRVPCDGGPY